jgi:hypothetical protein
MAMIKAEKTNNQREDASRRRVQMDLPPKTMERLEKLKASLEAVSYAEVMKDALRLLEYIDEQYSNGNRFYIEDKNGHMREVRLFV